MAAFGQIAVSVSGGRGGCRLSGCGILGGLVEESGTPLAGGEDSEAQIKLVGVGFEGVGVAGAKRGDEADGRAVGVSIFVVNDELPRAGGDLKLAIVSVVAEGTSLLSAPYLLALISSPLYLRIGFRRS
jgi:hypothetical protein